jgi:hypothetical protein
MFTNYPELGRKLFYVEPLESPNLFYVKSLENPSQRLPASQEQENWLIAFVMGLGRIIQENNLLDNETFLQPEGSNHSDTNENWIIDGF